MALVVGSNLTDLGQASLAEQALRDRRRQAGFDAARRAYEFENLSAAQRADEAMRRNQLGLQRDVAFAPWERGMTPTETSVADYRNALLAQQGRIAERPYQQMTRAEEAADKRAQQIAANQLTIAGMPYASSTGNARLQYGLGLEELGLRESLANLPWERGMTPAESAADARAQTALRNQLTLGTLPYFSPTGNARLQYQLGNEELGLRRDVAFAPWERGMTPAQEADEAYRNRALEMPYKYPTADKTLDVFADPLRRAQSNYYNALAEGGGMLPREINALRERDRLEDEEFVQASEDVAAQANTMLQFRLPVIQKQIADKLNTFGFGFGRSSANANKIASDIVSGADLSKYGDDQSVLESIAEFNTAIAQIYGDLGADARVIQFDPTRKRFVSRYGRRSLGQVEPTEVAPVAVTPPVVSIVRDANGRLVPAGRAGAVTAPVLPAGPTVTPALPPTNQLVSPRISIGGVPVSGTLGAARATAGALKKAGNALLAPLR